MLPSSAGPERKLLTCTLRNFFSVIIAVCLLCYDAISQTDLPPPFEIKTDTAAYTKLPPDFVQVLADPEGNYSLEQVRDSSTGIAFSYNKTDNQLASADQYWMRFVLRNSTDRQIKIWLGFGHRFNSLESDIYLIRPGEKITHENNGGFSPWSQLTGLKNYRLIPTLLEEGESVIVYWRLKEFITSEPAKRFFNLVGFFSVDAVLDTVVDSSHKQYYLAINDAFIVGVLLFASVFIFFFFINIREKVYLYFAFYLIALAVGRLNTSWIMYDLFFREFPGVYFFLFHLVWFFALFFLVYFVRNLLHVKDHFPKWDKVLMLSNYMYAALYLIHLITTYIGGNASMTLLISDLMAVALNFFIVLTFIRCAGRNRNNHVFLYVILPLQTLWSILQPITAVDRNTPKTVWPWLFNNWFLIETVLLCLLVTGFCWMLLQRYGEMRKQLLQKDLEKEIEKNQLISQQNEILELQVKERTAALSKSLEELKLTQSQLIQAEKMASLGELTAGIAHEIQNPLNFVNNFSEVSNEMIDDLNSELDKGNISAAKEIGGEVQQNLEKVLFHGKRADAVVKGMLQHSQSGSGQKEPADINSLCDEYLRLAYHGYRAKDKFFTAALKTDFEKDVGKVDVVPQDISRVVLNLINNAFYAVSEKQKKNLNGYEPAVGVKTKRDNGTVKISVSDNGHGIPPKVLEKIFQPFFTTKPTGQGTGLGLSLAYDIVTKGHGGELKVETMENQGSTFTIVLPV